MPTADSGQSNFAHEQSRIGLILRMAREIPKRYLSEPIAADLAEKMVFLSGTRQVGKATLSVKSLREDLEVAHDTAERWLSILENLYVCFRIAPFGSSRIRAVKKERKLYLWDWSMVNDAGARFENLVASHLLKLCHFSKTPKATAWSCASCATRTGGRSISSCCAIASRSSPSK
jgi:predicted AAA+ superfamily ATPase